jgi:hypothetical protein
MSRYEVLTKAISQNSVNISCFKIGGKVSTKNITKYCIIDAHFIRDNDDDDDNDNDDPYL